MDSYPIPYFEQQPLFFAQNRLRRDLAERREGVVNVLRNAIHGADAHLNERFLEGEEIRSLVHERAMFIDCILHYAWHQFCWSDEVALIAVGGYGRAELHPKSDIDILILLDDENAGDLESAQEFLVMLWDIRLEIGHSVRTLEHCLDFARQDITVATNVMECRLITGSRNLWLNLKKNLMPDNLWPTQEFFQAKWEEQKARHQKYHYSAYSLEPNIKNAPGGLRDIQTIGWIAKRHFGVNTLDQLGGQDFFTEEEFAVLISGEEFLWKVRYGLHQLAGRAEERLLFDYQRQLATMFGYRDTDHNLAVEQFMARYYRVVSALRELNDVLLHYLEDAVFERNENPHILPINSRFQLRDHYIEVTSADVFRNTPSALLEIFLIMGRRPEIVGVSPGTIRLLREHRNLIDKRFRDDPRNTQLFIEILKCGRGLSRQLKRMQRYNILGRYLPEFGRIIGQMQYDLFHIYTVDQHTLQVIENICSLDDPASLEKYSQAYYCVKALPKPELLPIAGLYHDIAKGRGGDHSTLGATDAYDFCLRHGYRRHDARLVAWLVENHLLMSQVSQKKDLSDPEVIHEFALQMGDEVHLNYLFALTVADINATNPNLWTTWRASLMRQLYNETKRILRRGLENPIDKKDIIEETQETAMRTLVARGLEKESVERLWSYLGENYFLHESPRDIVWQSESIIRHNSQEDLLEIRETTNLKYEGATEIFIRTRNRKSVFVLVATTLDQLGLSIQDARIYNSDRGGYAVDTFYVLDENNLPIGNNPHKVETIQQALEEALHREDYNPESVRKLTPRQLKHFSFPTRTSISNDIKTNTTLLEVITADRVGLLATIAKIFYRHQIQLNSAKIATLGERVEDIFYISDADGKPLSDPEFCRTLQDEIKSAIDQQVEGSNSYLGAAPSSKH